ncbi:MAG: sugar phosphate isomerase/epimerase [Verrucomicrobia bacterium]|nr:sugar phosphate isomerase/epimerase [Verrucomicrobiota bacterium]
MKPILSLSTSWCSHRHNDGYTMLREMADLGFEYVELSHGIRITLVPGILKAVEEGVVKVSSTHNFCPLPTGVVQAAPNLFEPSAREHREHDQWLRHTKRSIDFAAQVKAKVVVCHLGSVVFFWFNPARKIRKYLEAHHDAGRTPDDKVYHALVAKSLVKLRKRMGPFWEQTKASLNEVYDYASQKGVKLGLENREKFEELPLDADYAEFIKGQPANAPIGYWHDTGHADIKEGMGLLNHRQHLTQNAPRLIGFHLHDVSAQGSDHQAVGSGHIDFKMVSEFWRPEHLLTLELSPRIAVADVKSSKAKIESLM